MLQVRINEARDVVENVVSRVIQVQNVGLIIEVPLSFISVTEACFRLCSGSPGGVPHDWIRRTLLIPGFEVEAIMLEGFVPCLSIDSEQDRMPAYFVREASSPRSLVVVHHQSFFRVEPAARP